MLKNVKSIHILQEIFINIHKKIKLKIIKHNKELLSRLDIKKKDFNIYSELIEFNKKYKFNIKDIDIRELDLKGENVLNENALKIFDRIKFINITKLDLSNNLITTLDLLLKLDLNELKVLILKNNDINDITSLGKIKIEKLEILDLSENKIKCICPLKKVKFEKLEVLDLSENWIDDKHAPTLEHFNFKELKEY